MSNLKLNIVKYNIPTIYLTLASHEALKEVLETKPIAENISLWLRSQPIVLNVCGCSLDDIAALDFEALQKVAFAHGFFICGISSGNDQELNKKLLEKGITPFTDKSQASVVALSTAQTSAQASTDDIASYSSANNATGANAPNSSTNKDVTDTQATQDAPGKDEALSNLAEDSSNTLVHYGNLRSGTRLYAKGKSLVVVGNVGNGADAIADGCIFVFGSARGRLIAGAKGNRQSVIYCESFNPELISIGGIYQTNEDIQNNNFNKRILASLSANSFNFEIQGS